ncbi:hypothetical protein HGRIS_008277 [Hohenbuehelia grisea]|uniref:Uncharacterized protein n=1 Tax=Hohenbuehelia grisea TaxID=104357 RepID=A0ABR3J7H5_9AGAR
MHRASCQRAGLRVVRSKLPFARLNSSSAASGSDVGKPTNTTAKANPRISTSLGGISIPSTTDKKISAARLFSNPLADSSGSFRPEITYLLKPRTQGSLTLAEKLAQQSSDAPSLTTPSEASPPPTPQEILPMKRPQPPKNRDNRDKTNNRREGHPNTPRGRDTRSDNQSMRYGDRDSQQSRTNSRSQRSMDMDINMDFKTTIQNMVAAEEAQSRSSRSQRRPRDSGNRRSRDNAPRNANSSRRAQPRAARAQQVSVEALVGGDGILREMSMRDVDNWDPDQQAPQPPTPPSDRAPDVDISVGHHAAIAPVDLATVYGLERADELRVALGDYSEYVPKSSVAYAADCAKLGPAQLSELVLARHRDFSIPARNTVKDIVNASI